MWRLTDRTVRSGFVMAWRLATSPTRISPFFANPTTEGVVREPSAFGMTAGSPASSTETTEFVVPRSIPTARAIWLPPSPCACDPFFSALEYRTLSARVSTSCLEPVFPSPRIGSRRARSIPCDAPGYAPPDARAGRAPRRDDRDRRGPGRATSKAPHQARPPGSAGRSLRRRARAGRARGDRGPRAAQALPAAPAGADARPDLLGLPRPADHDRRGRGAADRPGVRAPADRQLGVARARPGRVRGRQARRHRDRAGPPAGPAARTLRGEPPDGGLPDPRPDLLDRPHAVPRAGRAGRPGLRARLVVDPRVHVRLLPVHLDVGGLAADLHVALPLAPHGPDPGVPRLHRILQAPAHRHQRDQRLPVEHEAARHARAAADRPGGCRWRRVPGRRHGYRPHPQGAPGSVRVHRMRTVSERVPRLEHR